MVDIRPSTDVAATAEVTDEYRNTSGGKMQESRAIKAASVPLTKSALLQQMTPSNAQDATQVIELMENYGFDQFGTTNYVQFGLTYPADGGDFHPLAYFGKNGIATYPLKVTRDLLGADEMIAFHQKANELGRFYTEDQVQNPDSTDWRMTYQQLKGVATGYVSLLDQLRSKIIAALQANEPI